MSLGPSLWERRAIKKIFLKAAADRTLKEFGQLLAKIVSQFSWPGRYVYVFFHYFHTLRVYPLPQAVPVSRTRP